MLEPDNLKPTPFRASAATASTSVFGIIPCRRRQCAKFPVGLREVWFQTSAMTLRQSLGLLGVILLAVAGSYLLRSNRPLGVYVGDRDTARDILADSSAPQAVHGTGEVTLVVFTDYRCPACRRSDPAMRAAIARDGDIRVVYRDWPIFGEPSRNAAQIALAAEGQGIYPAVHHAFMALPSFDEPSLRRVVLQAGGDWDRLQGDLQERARSIAARLARNELDAFGLGLEGTPGYLIGPYLVKGAMTEAEFLRAFEQARSTPLGRAVR